MKIIGILLSSAFLCVTMTSASLVYEPTGTTVSDLRARIMDLVDSPSIGLNDNESATIEFRLNAEGDIEVIHVYAENKDVSIFLEDRLNGQESNMKIFKINQSYFIEVQFISES